MSISGILRNFFVSPKESNQMIENWAEKTLPPADQYIGLHGTTIPCIEGNKMGRFSIQPNQIAQFTTTKPLYLLSHHNITTAVRYGLGLESSSTGNRTEDEGIDGIPAVIVIRDVDSSKLTKEFGCLVIPPRTEFTAEAFPICEKVEKVARRAHILPRAAMGMLLMTTIIGLFCLGEDAEKTKAPSQE